MIKKQGMDLVEESRRYSFSIFFCGCKRPNPSTFSYRVQRYHFFCRAEL